MSELSQESIILTLGSQNENIHYDFANRNDTKEYLEEQFSEEEKIEFESKEKNVKISKKNTVRDYLLEVCCYYVSHDYER